MNPDKKPRTVEEWRETVVGAMAAIQWFYTPGMQKTCLGKWMPIKTEDAYMFWAVLAGIRGEVIFPMVMIHEH